MDRQKGVQVALKVRHPVEGYGHHSGHGACGVPMWAAHALPILVAGGEDCPRHPCMGTRPHVFSTLQS